MFALEIDFKDGSTPPEQVFLRRPHALIGSSEYAHVVIEDLAPLAYQFRITRDVGAQFRCAPVGLHEGAAPPSGLEGVYEGEAEFDLGPVRVHVVALDTDLLTKEGEPPDRGGVRVLRQASVAPSPRFPALALPGGAPMVISFSPEHPVYVGRSRDCLVRLDSAGVSAKHLRVEYESGQFWIEDLGSTNGTFIGQQQVSGRVNVAPGQPIVVARETTLIGVTTEQQVQQLGSVSVSQNIKQIPQHAAKYPALVSNSEIARPSRVVLAPGMKVVIGRDPKSDLWLGAPHVSRMHCTVAVDKQGRVTASDNSMNGTAWDDGILRKGELLELTGDPKVLDFGGAVTVGVCFDEDHEQRYFEAEGSPDVFRDTGNSAGVEATIMREAEWSSERSASGRGRPSFTGVAARFLRMMRSTGLVGRLLVVFAGAAFVIVVAVLVSLFTGL